MIYRSGRETGEPESQARAWGGNIPVIVLTGFAWAEGRMRAMIAGYNLHLSKPIEPTELMAAVASLAGKLGGWQQNPRA